MLAARALMNSLIASTTTEGDFDAEKFCTEKRRFGRSFANQRRSRNFALLLVGGLHGRKHLGVPQGCLCVRQWVMLRTRLASSRALGARRRPWSEKGRRFFGEHGCRTRPAKALRGALGAQETTAHLCVTVAVKAISGVRGKSALRDPSLA